MSHSDLARDMGLLAGYLMVRMSVSVLKRSGKDMIQVTIFDRNPERLEWARSVLARILPPSRQNKPIKVVWVEGRKQGSIHVTGRRAKSLLSKLGPYAKGTPLQDLLARGA